MSDSKVQILVDFVEGFGVDAFSEVRVLFRPVFENKFEVRADPNGLFQQLLNMFV